MVERRLAEEALCRGAPDPATVDDYVTRYGNPEFTSPVDD